MNAALDGKKKYVHMSRVAQHVNLEQERVGVLIKKFAGCVCVTV